MPSEISVKTGEVVVLVLPNDQYTKRIVEISKYLASSYKSVCYVSLNKLFDSLIASLKSASIDQSKFLFLDGITKSANPEAKASGNCLFISSDINELGSNISRVLAEGKCDSMLFDSISTLLVYNKSEEVSMFVKNVIGKVRGKGITAVFTALEGDTQSELLKDIGKCVDSVSSI